MASRMVGVKEAYKYLLNNEDYIVSLDGAQVILSAVNHIIFKHDKSDIIIDSDVASTECFEIVEHDPDPDPEYIDYKVEVNKNDVLVYLGDGAFPYPISEAQDNIDFEGYIYEGFENHPYGQSVMWKNESGDLYYKKIDHSKCHLVCPIAVRFKK